ncbi:MAG: hypothetical protein WBA89_00615 [Microcoleus sp.]|uniref:hypothetical protein n=1 Tax=Microcoleus sp. TaxID=44472 RepID=UPI003C76AAAE
MATATDVKRVLYIYGRSHLLLAIAAAAPLPQQLHPFILRCRSPQNSINCNEILQDSVKTA